MGVKCGWIRILSRGCAHIFGSGSYRFEVHPNPNPRGLIPVLFRSQAQINDVRDAMEHVAYNDRDEECKNLAQTVLAALPPPGRQQQAYVDPLHAQKMAAMGPEKASPGEVHCAESRP